MNGMSINDICCLFCCPPLPSRIAAKLAFYPPDPTYGITAPSSSSSTSTTTTGASPSSPPTHPSAHSEDGSNNTTGGGAAAATPVTNNTTSPAVAAQSPAPNKFSLHLSEKAEWQFGQRELDCIEVFHTRTSRNNKVVCMFVRCSPAARFTLLFSHGNAVDLGQISSFYLGLGTRINCNVFSYDYSGYGRSTGKPSEKNLYADIDAAWHALRTRYGISPQNIILYGQSIGTVPTIDLGARYEVAAVILHSPLMSGMRVAFQNTNRTWCFDAFPSIDKVPKVTSPILVIHGTEDEVIDFSHGLAIYEKCQRPVEPLWVEGAGHNDVELYTQYLERLKQFVTTELAN